MKKILLIIALMAGILPAPFVTAVPVVVIPLGGDEHYLYWQGEWAEAASYKVGDAVQYEGSSYVCTQAHTSVLAGAPPSANWDLLAKGTAQKGSVFRWQVFSSYLNNVSWVMGNRADLHGGVTPSFWTDGGARASQMSSNAEVLRTLLTRKGYGGANAMVHSEVYHQYSSTSGRVVVALFRIKNTTASAINWVPNFYHSCYGGWSERASVSINGGDTWNSGGTSCTASSHANITVSVPANQISTVIFTAGSSTGALVSANVYVRYVNLTFDNDSLALPQGLEYVDDLDSAVGLLW